MPDNSGEPKVIEDTVSDEDEDAPIGRPARNRQPPARFTYDTLGEPTVSQVQQSESPPAVPQPQVSAQGPWTTTRMTQVAGWTWLPQFQNFAWIPPMTQFPSMYPPSGKVPAMHLLHQ